MNRPGVDVAWRSMFAGLREALWLVDAQSLNVVLCNRAAADLAGLPQEAMEGRPVHLLACTPEDLAFWSQDLAGLRAGIHSHSGMLRPDGSLVPVDRRVAAVESPEGMPLLVLGMLDRSEQASIQGELERLLSELRATLDSAADGMLVCDMGGRVRAFNQRMAWLWNMPEDLLVQRNDAAVEAHMAGQFTDADAYRARLLGIAQFPEEETLDILHLRTGTVIERRSVPQMSQGRPMGRVYSFRDLTLQHAAQKRIEQLAYSDVLTGLPNRLLLSRCVASALETARAQGGGFAILFIDLDRFKIINDSLGHLFGDRVLQLVAQRLQGCLRQNDMLCRLGGDEFVLHLDAGDESMAESLARRILEDMRQPFMLDGMGFSIQCSIGIALHPRDGESLDDLIKQADTAMYRVKERGRGSYGFYQPQMNADMLSRMQLEHAMRQALDRGDFAVHYQPQVAMASGRMVGAEALLRWNDPGLGAVSPGVFIPLAEESGYIVTLGAWVLEQAIREAAGWMQAGTPLVVAVNVSALEFRQSGFVERLVSLLRSHGLPASLLELELTETILLQDAQEMAQRLAALAELGVGLSIDDFGTGYSSLAYLKKLRIHKLKIDQSFVRGLPDDESDRAIIEAIVHIGRALRIQVVAEGVETPQQREALQAMQCHYFQGFLVAPGLPAEDFRALVARDAQGGCAPT
ncbi:putative bifunctional diguanylate cyclase/phosphodiesterase [Paracidovorax avenae]|uniref:putative bifunctional diguanylate cyclase/phosphodiesterase n=1 Tax=Paracidovorax avenae TaxID=80867 RepID=UPI000D22A523|nr:bifunctional diguanylate cyclase/phosphodiesterase [Paracidovorax avenae]AVS95557.1 diguanylate cyclase [Paracidovorax avenae]AVT02228.1 diguanylate cyclase [Paracidovorax avenae]AVT09136.1 diguanylate cyclase [Paracidovorax avenae]